MNITLKWQQACATYTPIRPYAPKKQKIAVVFLPSTAMHFGQRLNFHQPGAEVFFGIFGSWDVELPSLMIFPYAWLLFLFLDKLESFLWSLIDSWQTHDKSWQTLGAICLLGGVNLKNSSQKRGFIFPNFRREHEKYTLQGTNISHLGKRKIIFKMPFWGDMLVPWRVDETTSNR